MTHSTLTVEAVAAIDWKAALLKLGAFALQLLLAELSGAVGAAPAGTPAP